MTCLTRHLAPSRWTRLSPRGYATTQFSALEGAALVQVNSPLLQAWGLGGEALSGDYALALLSGRRPPPHPSLATVYAGHQFGVYTSQLGDGRVHTLGDVVAADGARWELQLKGAGATAYARGNSGRMSLAEAITEYLGAEALAGLGIPGSRGLAIVGSATPAEAVLVRTAPSHLRFGHLEYWHNQAEPTLLRELVDHVIEQHYPALLGVAAEGRYLQWLYAVTLRSAQLIAQWQAAGFVHAVMNTDNMSLLGLSLDLGVYGFMEAYDPGYSPNPNDDQGRYAYDQQVEVGRWNCLALAEAMTPLLPERRPPAGLLRLYRQGYHAAYQQRMRTKLGLTQAHADDVGLIGDLLALLQHLRSDYTDFMRRLAAVDSGATLLAHTPLHDRAALHTWLARYRRRLAQEPDDPARRAARMRTHNPAYILRRAALEQVTQRAEAGDYAPLAAAVAALRSPYREQASP